VSERLDPNDELMKELRAVVDQVDPIPSEVTEFAKAALGLRRLDADLAELLADSALETQSTALIRSGESARRLTFRAEEISIDLEVNVDGDARLLLGQLAPAPAVATVEVQSASGEVVASTGADALGRFRLALESGGRVRLRIVLDDPPGTPVETSWLSV
jgi:hypothetical protein